MNPYINNTGDKEQWLYYRELRIKRKRDEYNNALFAIKGFAHSSIGLKLMEEIRELEKEAEGVEWLPKCACNPCQKSEKSLQDCNPICKCNCHKTELPHSREEVDTRVEALLNLIDPANYDKKQFRSKFLHG